MPGFVNVQNVLSGMTTNATFNPKGSKMTDDRFMAEKWVPMIYIDPFYEISNYGRVRSWKHKNGKRKKPFIMKPSEAKKGRYQIHLWIHGTRIARSISRMVLTYFIGPPPTPKHEAAHNDGDPSNNYLSNLRWATP